MKAIVVAWCSAGLALAGGAEPMLCHGRHEPFTPGAGRGLVVYSDVTFDTGYTCDCGEYECGDALVMIAGGELEQVTLVWHDQPDGLPATSVLIRVYNGPAGTVFHGDGTDVPVAVLLDQELPGEGLWKSTFDFPPGTQLPSQIVVTAQWDTAGPYVYGIGLRIMHPPTIGTSADWYFSTYFGPWCWFEGDPVANLAFEIVVAGQSQFAKADMDCSGKIDAFDIDPFVLALVDSAGYEQKFPACDIDNGDINGDGAVDAFDITPFVECIVQGGCP